MAVYNSILELIGKTPLIKLNKLNKTKNNIFLKVESFNPGGSVKDRIALNMIEEAEKKGLLNKDSVIIEPTSGNTGIGLAMVCAVKGYKLIIVMPDNMSIERVKLLRAYGAEVILTSGKFGMKGSMDKLEELQKIYPNHFTPNQFKNDDNPDAHRKTTGVELLNDLGKNIDIFVGGIGTGGSLTGTVERLKEDIPHLKAYAVEPSESAVLSGKERKPHMIQGIGLSAGFIPHVLHQDVIDEILTVNYEDSKELTRALAKEEGIFVGVSSGAALKAALNVAEGVEGKNIVVLLMDTGHRYLSNEIFE